MVPDDQLAEVEHKIYANLRRTGVNFIFLWLISVGVVWAAANYRHVWLLVTASGLLGVLFLVACIPNIGHTAALNKMYGGMLLSVRRHVILADVGAGFVLYAVAALWWNFPAPALATLGAALIAILNSLGARNA